MYSTALAGSCARVLIREQTPPEQKCVHLTQLVPLLCRLVAEGFQGGLRGGGAAPLLGELGPVAPRVAVLRLQPLLRRQRGFPPRVSFALHLVRVVLSALRAVSRFTSCGCARKPTWSAVGFGKPHVRNAPFIVLTS